MAKDTRDSGGLTIVAPAPSEETITPIAQPKRVRKPKDPEIVQLKNDLAFLQDKYDGLLQERMQAGKELSETQARMESGFRKACVAQSDMLTYKAMLLNTREQLQSLVTNIDILIRKEDNRHGT